MKGYRKEPTCLDCKKALKNHYALRCHTCANSGKNSPNYKYGDYVRTHFCVACKIVISPLAIRCSKCKILYQKRENNPNWRGGKSYNNVCIDCKKSISYAAKRCRKCANNRPRNISSRKGKNNSNYGKKHPGLNKGKNNPITVK